MNSEKQNQNVKAKQNITLKALQDELSKEDLEMVSGGINRATSIGLEGEHDMYCAGCPC